LIDLNQIESFYPEHLRKYKVNILREYFQYKILEIIYDSKFSTKLIFMGGTAVRIIHGSGRFSEDLDFDNFNLTGADFEDITETIHKKLALEGYQIEIRNVFKGAFHCYLSISSILHENQISGHKEEKLMIRLDTEPQGFSYIPRDVIINKFDVFTRIHTVPAGLLLSQKIYAILNRKRTMGRDLYDAVYLFSRTKPDFKYLQHRMNIHNMKDLKSALLSKCDTLDLKLLSRDVEPFLANVGDTKRIKLFKDAIQNLGSS
jgi:predicted nucleotidyltransferase component of viral defense system